MHNKTKIKLNDNNNYLSLGNIFRLIKESSIDSTSYFQTDLFSIIFNCDILASSTVNNYCTGQRAINPKYKSYILKKKDMKKTNELIFINEISIIVNLINTGKLENVTYNVSKINNNSKLKLICTKLYSISKNDSEVSLTTSNMLSEYLNTNNLYDFFCEALFFAVLERTQPVYCQNVLTDLIEKNIENTNISVTQYRITLLLIYF